MTAVDACKPRLVVKSARALAELADPQPLAFLLDVAAGSASMQPL